MTETKRKTKRKKKRRKFRFLTDVFADYSKTGKAPKSLSEANKKYLYAWTGGNAGELKTFSNFL